MSETISAPLLPSFEPWPCYSTEDLQAIVQGWRWILDRPAWSAWHEAGAQCITEICQELAARSDRDADD